MAEDPYANKPVFADVRIGTSGVRDPLIQFKYSDVSCPNLQNVLGGI